MKIAYRSLKQIIKETILQEAKLLLEGIDQKGALEIIKSHPKDFKKEFGIDVDKESFKFLGTGNFGTAFEVDGKVLKITTDTSEAEAASKFVGKHVEGINDFYVVAKFANENVYAIFQKKLSPMSSGDKQEFNKALIKCGLPVWIKSSYSKLGGGSGVWDNAKEETKNYIKKKVLKNPPYNSPENIALVKEANDAWKLLVDNYNLKAFFDILDNYGISFHDYQADNMMLDENGKPTLIDLGLSKVKDPGKIKDLAEGKIVSIKE